MNETSLIPESIEAVLEGWGWQVATEAPTALQVAAGVAAVSIADGIDLLSAYALMGALPETREREIREEIDRYGGKVTHEAISRVEPSAESYSDQVRAVVSGKAYYNDLSVLAPHPAMASAEGVAALCNRLDAVLTLTSSSAAVLVFSSYSDCVRYSVAGGADGDAIVKALGGTKPLLAVGHPDGVASILPGVTANSGTDEDESGGRRWYADTEQSDEGRWLRRLVSHAVGRGATDISLMPGSLGEYSVRMRLNGELVTPKVGTDKINATWATKILRLLQRHAGVNTRGVRVRRPLDGHIIFVSSGVPETDIRASFIPIGSLGDTRDIQSISLRLFPRLVRSINLQSLRVSDAVLSVIVPTMRTPQGLVIVAGPMNSGKSTTIAGLVGEHVKMFGDRKRRLSVEDPVERFVDGVTQINVPTTLRAEDGSSLTERARFATMLRAVKRHDVNVLWVGEVRDQDSAEFCVSFSASGHLVLTTIHAQDIVSAIDIFSSEIGADYRYQFCESLSLVLSQRLIRRLCPGCKVERAAASTDRDLLNDRCRALGEGPYDLPATLGEASTVGCEACDYSGYQGSMPINGVLQFDKKARAAAVARVVHGDLGGGTELENMRSTTLLRSAMKLIGEGEISLVDGIYF